ncbi:helix-turn-helix transcriptional regulator [Methylomonas sp. AM2-LC]|uniref:helix-turn-helix domain-containing protein n=1 Tax=Methylomonas sp. AM2-LC TaxID=3153301 RepID=UPI0032650AAA
MNKTVVFSKNDKEMIKRKNVLPPRPAKEMKEALLIELGERAKNRRIDLGIYYKDLAEIIGVNPATVKNWEGRGIPQGIQRSKVIAWEKALQVPPGWVLNKKIATPKAPEQKTFVFELKMTKSSIELERFVMPKSVQNFIKDSKKFRIDGYETEVFFSVKSVRIFHLIPILKSMGCVLGDIVTITLQIENERMQVKKLINAI